MTETGLSPIHLGLETHTLPNGLRVAVHHDDTSPIVAAHLMYHAGSRHERPGRTGLAHLLEHLLFEGSLHTPKGEFDRRLERVGGTNNGSTWLDRTNYYEVVPSHALELALWLERDRMGFFLPVLDEEMLELQRGVVMNERLQVYENRPYGLADERLHQLLFPDGHPYSWPTIGYMDDLRAITLGDAREFFSTFYAPANAVLVLSGDVVPDRGFQLADRYFGDLPSPPPPAQPPALSPDAPRRDDDLGDSVTFPRVYRAFPVPSFGSREWMALDVLAYILSDGDSSRLQQRLVRDLELVQDVDAYLYPTELHGVFGIVATARSGVSAEQLRSAIESILEEVADRGVEPDEAVGAIRRARRDHLSSLGTVENRAEEIAYTATVLGDPHLLPRLLTDYATIQPEEIRAAAAAYLGADRGASLAVLPETHA